MTDCYLSMKFYCSKFGIQINWDSIKGLKESIGTNGVCSNYSYTYVDSTWREIENLKEEMRFLPTLIFY